MIDLTAAKAHLRVVTTDEDSLIGAFIAAAISAVQDATAKLLAAADVPQTVDGFPGNGSRSAFGRVEPYHANVGVNQQAIRLWKGPVSAIVSVKYDDSNGVEQTLVDYRLIEGTNAKLLPPYGASWPLTAVGPGTVRIVYTAGYADDEVPAALDQAVLLLVGHYYVNREAVRAGDRAAAIELPFGVEALLAPYTPPGIA